MQKHKLKIQVEELPKLLQKKYKKSSRNTDKHTCRNTTKKINNKNINNTGINKTKNTGTKIRCDNWQ